MLGRVREEVKVALGNGGGDCGSGAGAVVVVVLVVVGVRVYVWAGAHMSFQIARFPAQTHPLQCTSYPPHIPKTAAECSWNHLATGG